MCTRASMADVGGQLSDFFFLRERCLALAYYPLSVQNISSLGQAKPACVWGGSGERAFGQQLSYVYGQPKTCKVGSHMRYFMKIPNARLTYRSLNVNSYITVHFVIQPYWHLTYTRLFFVISFWVCRIWEF